MKRCWMILLALMMALLSFTAGAENEEEIPSVPEAQTLTMMDSEIMLMLPPEFEFKGTFQGSAAYRHEKLAVSWSYVDLSLEDYTDSARKIGMTPRNKTVEQNGIRARLFDMEDQNMPIAVVIQNTEKPELALVEVNVIRANASEDVETLAKIVSESAAAVSLIARQDKDVETWAAVLELETVGLSLVLPVSMSVTFTENEDGSMNFMFSNGLVRIPVLFFQGSIGEIEATFGLTSDEYEIEEKSFGDTDYWEYRFLRPGEDQEYGYLVYPGGVEGTWLMMGFFSPYGQYEETIWHYLDTMPRALSQI